MKFIGIDIFTGKEVTGVGYAPSPNMNDAYIFQDMEWCDGGEFFSNEFYIVERNSVKCVE